MNNRNQTVIALESGKTIKVKVQAGQHYRMRKPDAALAATADAGDQAHPDHLIAARQGQALLLRYADGSSVLFEDFYSLCQDASVCSVTVAADSAAGIQLSADTAGATVATSDGSTLVYAHGAQDLLMSMARGDAGLVAAFEALGMAPVLSYLLPSSTLAALGGIGEVAVVPGFAGLMLTGETWALAGAAGLGGSASTAPSLVLGVIQAGPVTPGNDLEVTLFAADGLSVLVERVAVDSSGNFSATVGSYTGVVIAKLRNLGTATDYLDEATNAGKDLNATLVAAGVVRTPGATLSLNLNALTTLAYYQLGADHSPARVEAVNAAVARAFGLDNLQSTAVVTTNGGSYNPADGLSEGEKYGAVLAALSGMDKLNGGSVQATLDRLNSQLSLSGTTATLSDAVKYEIAAGAKTVASLAANGVVTGQFGDAVSALIQFNSNPETQAQGLAVIAAYAGGAAGATVPSVFDYANANVTGVDSAARLQLINEVVHAMTSAQVDSSAEVQALADAVSAVILAAAGGTPPTLAQLQMLGISGLTSDNLAAVLQAIAASPDDATAVDSVAELQALVSAAALSAISAAAQANSASANTPAISIYTDAGVTGVTATNLAAINSALNSASVVGASVDTKAEVQALVDAYLAILNGADGIANGNAHATPTDYATIGVTGVTATIGGLLDSSIDKQSGTALDTVAKLQSLADAAKAVVTGAAGGTAPTKAQLESLGLTGITDDNLNAIQHAIAATPDDGSGVSTLTQLQTIASDAAAAAAAALNSISAAAQANNASASTPAISVYTDAGVTGVTVGNLAAINDALDSAAIVGTSVDTTAEVQALVDAYNAILNSADGVDNVATANNPTPGQYTAIGVTGVDSSAKAGLLGDVIDTKTNAAVDSVAEVQSLADAVTAVINGAGGGTPPTLIQLQDLGLTGINGDNLAAIQHAIAASPDDGSGVDSKVDLQTIVNAINTALGSIGAYAQANSASAPATPSGSAPTLQIYLDAGVSGVTSGNLASINDALATAAVTGASVDSIAKVQAVVDAYAAILAEANGATADATPGVNPSAAHYAAMGASLGAAASDAENLNLLNDILAAQTPDGVDTVAEIDNLARIANAIELTAAGGTPSPALTATDFALVGVSGVNDSNLATMLGGIAAQNDNGTATDTLAKLQALVSSTPPAAPLINTVAGDNLVNATEATTGFDITGTGEIGATVTVSFGSSTVLLGGNTVVVGANGSWTLHLTASDIAAMGQGLESLSASQTNIWSNTSGTAGTGSFTVDTVAPFTTVATAGFSADTGTGGDFVTKTAAQTISGTLSANLLAGESVQLSLDNGNSWATASASTGSNSWSLANQTLGGSNTLRVKVADTAGNSSTVFSQAYVLDTQAPTVTTVTDDVTASVTAGVIQFTVSFDEALVGSVGTGNFSASNGTVTAVAALGGNQYLVSVTPTAGVASASVALSLVGTGLTDAAANAVANANLAGKDSQAIDTLAAALNVNSIAGDSVAGPNQTGTFDATERGMAPSTVATPLVVAGTTEAEAGQTVTLTLNQHNYQALVAAGALGQLNTWSLTLPDADAIALNHGNRYAVLVAVTDLAGTLTNHNSDLLFYNVAFPDTPTILNNNTNNSTPTLTGQAQKIVNAAGNLNDPANYTALAAGDTLSVVINGVTITATIGSGAATNVTGVSYVAASNTWAVDTSALGGFTPLANGSYDVAVSVTAGGVTKSDISHNELVINTALPAISLNLVATDGYLNAIERTQPLQVTGITDAQVGQTVTVALNGHNYSGLVQAGVDATHNTFSVDVVAADLLALTDGSYPVDASITNFYGLTSHVTPSVVVDTQAPQVSTVTDGTAAALTNSSIAFTVSFDEAVVGSVGTSSFTASNASVTSVSSLGGNQYLVTVSPNANIASGTVSLSLVGTGLSDAAGNVVVSASLSSFDSQGIDTQAPTQVVTAVALSADTGPNGGSNTDLNTRTTTQTITAALSAGLAVGDVLYGSVDGGSTWLDISSKVSGTAISWDGATLVNGGALVFKLSDALGNTGANTGNTSYVLDTTGPSTTIASATLSTDSGNAGDFLTNTAAQTISGTLSANLALGEAVYVSLDNGGSWAVASAIVGANGWSLASQTLPSSGTLLVKVTDPAGNDGTVFSQVYSVDSLAPTLAISSNVSTLKAGETATITFTFSEDPGASFAWDGSIGDVVVSGGALGAISGSGLTRTATFTPNAVLASGNASITVASGSYTDAAGNNGGAGTTPSISIDTLAPTATLTAGTTTSTGSATVQSSEIGTAYLVKSSVSVSSLSDITSALDANWNSVSITSANSNTSLALTGLVDGAYNLYTVDAAGNLSSVSTNTVTIAAAGPTVNTIALTSATGIQNSTLNAGDVVTATVILSEAVTVSGTPQVALHIGSDIVQANYASNNGSGTLTFTYTILANQTDANGISIDADALSLNSGSILSTASSTPAALTHSAVIDNSGFLVDTTAPTAATVTSYSGDNNATVNAAEATVGLTISGTNEAGATVTLAGQTVVADTSTTWHVVLNSATMTGYGEGAESLSVVSTDVAGNTSSTPVNLTVDTIAPTAAVITSYSGDNNTTVNAAEATAGFTISGSNEAGSTVTLAGQSVVADSGTSWHVVLDSSTIAGYGQGPESLSFASTDAAGNTTSTPVSLSVDTVAPTATIADDETGTASGTVHFTFNFNETVTGFTSGSINVAGGTLGTLTGSGSSYAIDVTPTGASGNMTVGINTGGFSDVAGNVNTAATTSDVQPYDRWQVIDLGINGKLIDTTNISGNWFYYWDRNGNGIEDAGDTVDHNVLDGIFNKTVAGVTHSGDTTDTFHYGSLTTASGASLNVSLTPDAELISIIGAYGSFFPIDDVWTATQTTPNEHNLFSMNGYFYPQQSTPDTESHYVFLQVL